ncbi:hypothetical protein EXIGUO8H_10102 [Exiguobacterium sp. 8H]|nr:hypothetical protein EXIGUO8H_10102 [Exiguobacterium sp. 8H]VXB91631.1 hypothetical protein EXIGUO8A_110275 [Exiguobacterium sp. 8A]
MVYERLAKILFIGAGLFLVAAALWYMFY